jgi:glyoxalase family protein
VAVRAGPLCCGPSPSRGDDELAELAARSEAVVRLIRLLERECRLDGHDHLTACEQRQRVSFEPPEHVLLLLTCPRTQRRARDPAALAHQEPEIDRCLRAGACADHDDATSRGKPLDVRAQVLPADELQDHVVLTLWLGGRAERLDLLGVMANGAGDLGPEPHPELHRRNPHAPGCTVHEQPVAGSELPLREECVVRRCEHLDEASGLRPLDAVRDAQHMRVMYGDEFGVAATGEECHHALAGRDVLAGAFEAGDIGRGAGRRRVTAGALHHVGAIHAGRVHTNHDLALAGDRIGALLDPQAPIDDDGCTHLRHATAMKLEGVHHITCITGDAPANVEFYAGTLGLRMVKKTVNQDDPTVYHLFYADERGSAGSDITFFEYPGAPPGRAGDGMVHRVCFRVASETALDFWHERVGGERAEGSLVFTDNEGLSLELLVDDSGEEPLQAEAADIPEEHRIRGFAGVRAYGSQPDRSTRLLETLGFERGWTARGENRSGFYMYDSPPEKGGLQAAGTVHHVAWASTLSEHEAWRQRVSEGGGQPTPVIDRFYFKSIYFREPSGVLFEIATLGPGFTADEPLESLGEKLSLPPSYEQYRDQVEKALTPLPNPRLDRR